MLKKWMSAAIVLLSLISPVFADDATAIRKTLEDQVTAWNSGDLEGFMNGYLKSEELVFTSGGNVRRGWETTFRKYRERYGNATATMGNLAFSELEIHTLGSDAAWVLGKWKLVNQDESTDGGIFTLVMRNTPDGWRVVHDHTSVSTD